MDKILIIIGAILLIGFILWWFFSKRKTTEVNAKIKGSKQEVEIIINGGYTPHTVVLKQGIPANIVFNRKDPSGCFNEVVFPAFGIDKKIDVNKKFSIDIDTSKSGEYQYSCGMNMFHGKVIIK